MANERFTDLPVGTPALTDIICAVQGYMSPTAVGVSVQETLSSIIALASATIVKTYAGNPNGNVTGAPFNFCWDSVNSILYLNTVAGTSWNKVIELTAGNGISISQAGNTIQISATSVDFPFVTVTTSTQTMSSRTTYFVNYSGGLCTLTLPATSVPGDTIIVLGNSSSGWSIAQTSGQQITIGSAQSTLGAGGSVSSTNRYDSLQLTCTVANTFWQAPCGPQGSLTIA